MTNTTKVLLSIDPKLLRRIDTLQGPIPGVKLSRIDKIRWLLTPAVEAAEIKEQQAKHAVAVTDAFCGPAPTWKEGDSNE